jgi:hypothetical protein
MFPTSGRGYWVCYGAGWWFLSWVCGCSWLRWSFVCLLFHCMLLNSLLCVNRTIQLKKKKKLRVCIRVHLSIRLIVFIFFVFNVFQNLCVCCCGLFDVFLEIMFLNCLRVDAYLFPSVPIYPPPPPSPFHPILSSLSSSLSLSLCLALSSALLLFL